MGGAGWWAGTQDQAYASNSTSPRWPVHHRRRRSGPFPWPWKRRCGRPLPPYRSPSLRVGAFQGGGGVPGTPGTMFEGVKKKETAKFSPTVDELWKSGGRSLGTSRTRQQRPSPATTSTDTRRRAGEPAARALQVGGDAASPWSGGTTRTIPSPMLNVRYISASSTPAAFLTSAKTAGLATSRGEGWRRGEVVRLGARSRATRRP